MMKILIIGCGRIFPKHLESISKLNSLFKLVGVCDVDLKKRFIHVYFFVFYIWCR